MIYDTLTTQPKYVSHQLTLNSPTHNYSFIVKPQQLDMKFWLKSMQV